MSTNIQLGDKISFIKLFSQSELNVRIPIIQRDYAQGRPSAHEVRKAFLKALLSYLQAEGTHDLDFVYGAVSESQDFLPLDGQQRLTTLFLLHWYLAQISDSPEAHVAYYNCMFTSEGQVRFSYETRPSAKDFCQALLSETRERGLDLKREDNLSALIKEQPWYFLSWDRDPSITAMLTMLDDIHKIFYMERDGLAKLLDQDNPRLSFQFLDLKGFGLTDDLYIKMNARGKSLTPIETFKANLEQYLRHELHDEQRAKTFADKMDGQWADLMWCYRDKEHPEHASDRQWERVFQNLLSYSYALSEGEGPNGELSRLHRDFLSFNAYKELGCINEKSLDFITSVLDVLYNGEDKIHEWLGEEFRAYFSAEKSEKSEKSEKYWIYLLRNQNWSYNARLIFYAYVAYLIKFKPQRDNPADVQALGEWMRVVHNLYRGENLQINNEQNYVSALCGLRGMIEQGQPIYQLLSSGYSPDGVAGWQIAEEQCKAKLLLSDSVTWWPLISRAELHPYFLGQIDFLLAFSDKNACAFERYEGLSSKIFAGGYKDRPREGHLLERAVLTKGDYVGLSDAKPKANLLSSAERGKNIYRDYSWRRMLRSENSEARRENSEVRRENSEVRRLFKALLDDDRLQPDGNVEDIKQSLRRIIVEDLPHLEGKNISFRRALIKHPKIIGLSEYGFVQRVYEEEGRHSCRIVTKQNLLSYNYELQSYVLYLEMFDDNGMQAYKPFQKRDYKYRIGYKLPRIELTGFNYANVDYRAWIQHQINRKQGYADIWTLGFDKESGEQIISGTLSEYLEDLGFPKGIPKRIREFDTQEELIECLQKLCKKLQEL